MIFNNEQFDYTTLKMNINKKRKSLDSSFMENTNVKKFKNDDNSSDSNNNNCSIINNNFIIDKKIEVDASLTSLINLTPTSLMSPDLTPTNTPESLTSTKPHLLDETSSLSSTSSSLSSLKTTKEASTTTTMLEPCLPGTPIQLQGIVWSETKKGVLVLNVTWKGKTFVGALFDSNNQGWAAPRFVEPKKDDQLQLLNYDPSVRLLRNGKKRFVGKLTPNETNINNKTANKNNVNTQQSDTKSTKKTQNINTTTTNNNKTTRINERTIKRANSTCSSISSISTTSTTKNISNTDKECKNISNFNNNNNNSITCNKNNNKRKAKTKKANSNNNDDSGSTCSKSSSSNDDSLSLRTNQRQSSASPTSSISSNYSYNDQSVTTDQQSNTEIDAPQQQQLHKSTRIKTSNKFSTAKTSIMIS